MIAYSRPFCLIILISFLCFGCGKKKQGNEKEEKKTIKEIAKECEKYEGLFDIYQDKKTGALHMLVKKDQLDKEYIHFLHYLDGVLEAYAFRGAYRHAQIFKVSKNFNKIIFTLINTNYYFNPDNALSKAAKANINEPVFFVMEIESEDKKGNIIFKVDDLFFSEAFMQVKPSPDPDEKDKKRFKLGEISKDKSQILEVKNYPENTDIQVQLVYENKYPVAKGSRAVTDARSVSISLHHSLIRVPVNDYQPRLDDPRVGYFTEIVNDMTSVSATNYRDLIHRWYLVKKDKDAELSEPVEPIIWWIENTTPKELRPAIKEGVLQWNKAFESAGFKNAVVVKEQPDDAKWDAGDIRYNVLRWTSSPQPPFGGYGPSFVNPRTGQILGADVMLEYVFVTNRLRYEKLFDIAGFEFDQDEAASDGSYCTFGQFQHNNILFAQVAMNAMEVPDTEKDEFLKQSLYMLSMHEVGHTLGLNHNMKASQFNTPEQLNDRERGATIGLTGSVMDYSNTNISRDRSKQGLYYDIIPGPYDHWAIQYGYMDADQDQLDKLLARSTEKALYFGNDADDMRFPGKHIDPRVMIGDMSDDPMTFAEDRILLAKDIFPNLIDKYSEQGKSYHDLRNAFLTLTWQQWNSVRVISREIGGIYIDRAFAGQKSAKKPFIPVDYKTQKRAMTLLTKYAFAPDAFAYPSEVYNYLQMQRRGFENWDINEDPKLHERFLRIQQDVLDHLMHENVLQRITDSEFYGNEYSLNEMLTDLTDAVFNADIKTKVNSTRQNLQVEYVGRLTKIMDKESAYDNISKAMAFSELQRIKSMIKTGTNPDNATKVHREYLAFLIDKATEIR